jgi:hypothetical protein
MSTFPNSPQPPIGVPLPQNTTFNPPNTPGASSMPQQPQGNPLSKYFRQPKIYLRLPSEGKYYPPGAIDIPESGEVPVYAMTAKDELLFKTPDALLNGEATVDVIKSCIPNIKNPWAMPSIDSDAVLIAIRLATYGEKLDITTKVPGTGETKDFQIDLRLLLDQLVSFKYQPYINVGENISIEIKPTTYKEFTENSLKTFEEQKIFRLVNDDSIPDDQKLQAFANSFKKLTDITIGLVVNSVVAIDTPDGRVTNKTFIKDFFENADSTTFNAIIKHLEKMKEESSIKPLKVQATEEEIAAGAPAEYEIPITFDQSNFFG